MIGSDKGWNRSGEPRGRDLTFWRRCAGRGQDSPAVRPPDLPPVLGVVVHEHVLGVGVGLAGVDVVRGGDGHLETAHVPGVAGILQTVLVALEEKLELESGNIERGKVIASVSRHIFVVPPSPPI